MEPYIYWLNGDDKVMRFDQIDWADSQIEEIHIYFDYIEFIIWNDTFQEYCKVECKGVAGLTNLCIWDDTIIHNAKVYPATDPDDEFMINLHRAYGKDCSIDERRISDGFLRMEVELANGIAFNLYCQSIQVDRGIHYVNSSQ